MKTLLILAAGMGSRYGGLKQMEPVGPSEEFIIDYSIYDAKRVGFTKVVFVIKEENYQMFKDTIGKRVEQNIKTEYIFQDMKMVPSKYQELLKDRKKPLGTAHAILCAKDKVKDPFAVINADDFYGYQALKDASNYLDKMEENHYGMIAYQVENTLSPTGACTRGVCTCKNNKLEQIMECKVEKIENKIIAYPLDSKDKIMIPEKTPVSMNLLLFSPDFFSILEKEFYIFLEENKKNLEKIEYQIPSVLDKCIKKENKQIDIITTTAKWYGVTYKEDKEFVKKVLRELVRKNEYPHNLWKK